MGQIETGIGTKETGDNYTATEFNAVNLAINTNSADSTTRLGNTQGSGVQEGGYITTVFGETTYAIASGSGYIVDNYTNPEAPVVTTVTWAAKTGLTPGGLATLNTQFIGIDINGDHVEFDELPTEIEMRDIIYLGKLLINEITDTTIVGLTFPRMKYGFASQFDDLVGALRTINISGNDISANGANLSLDKTEGVTHRVGANYPSSYKNPSTITNAEDLAFTFSPNYRSVTPGKFINETDTTTLNPDKWDDGSGTLQDVPTGSFTVQRVYFFTNGNFFITYGQQLYGSFNKALVGVTDECPEVEEQFRVDASLRAIIVLGEGATSLLDTRKTKIAHADKFGDVSYPGGKLILDTRGEFFSSSAVGTYYTHGFYLAPSTDANLTQASPDVTGGTANQPYGAHAFIVAGGAGTASGGAGAVEIEVSGTSITDGGVRTELDTEVIVTDVTTLATNTYAESNKKWLGQVVITLQNASGSTQTNFAVDVNYGLAKYEDWGNRDIVVTQLQVTGTAGANDTGVEIELLKHQATGWTYAATGFVPGDGYICKWSEDYDTDTDLANGEQFAYKRVNLEESVEGTGNEGIIVRWTTGANNSIRLANVQVGAEFV
jgi:hypothetical protein